MPEATPTIRLYPMTPQQRAAFEFVARFVRQSQAYAPIATAAELFASGALTAMSPTELTDVAMETMHALRESAPRLAADFSGMIETLNAAKCPELTLAWHAWTLAMVSLAMKKLQAGMVAAREEKSD